MTWSYELDDFHAEQIRVLYSKLWRRRQQLKLSGSDASRSVGRRWDFVRRLESGQRLDQKLATLQDWCRAVDLRLRLWVPGFGPSRWPRGDAGGRFDDEHRSLWQYWNLSTMDGDAMIPDLSQRLWVPALLRAYRRQSNLDPLAHMKLLADMGMNDKGLWKWEAETTDPTIRRCMRYAQALGVQLRVDAVDPGVVPDAVHADPYGRWAAS